MSDCRSRGFIKASDWWGGLTLRTSHHVNMITKLQQYHKSSNIIYDHDLRHFICNGIVVELKCCQWAIILLSVMMINSDLPNLTDLSAAPADSFFLLSFNYSLSKLQSVLGSLLVLLNMNLRYKMDRFNWYTRRYY